MTTHQSIPLNRLVQSKSNVRRTARTSGIDELMASIAAHGLRQNLNVRPTTGGRFEVVAGGRRLIALKKLARLGTIVADAPVSCLVLAEEENATEISLAENQLRAEMHPDDQCEAFRTLAEALALDMTTHWQATPDFLARLSKPVLAQALTETGKTLVAENLGAMKKEAAVRYAHTALADTGWLPPALRAAQPAAVDEHAEEAAELEAEAA